LDTVKEAIDNLTNNIQSASIDIKEAHLQRIIDAKEREVVLLREELEMAKKTIADCRSAADQSKSMSELSAVVSDLLLRMNDLSSGDGELAARFKQLQVNAF
jgi:predicted RNase H-like nuclease (RuvC/YqgF family)